MYLLSMVDLSFFRQGEGVQNLPAHKNILCAGADSSPPLTFNYSPTVVIVHILNSKQSGRHEDGMASELLGLTEFQSTS